MKDLIENRRRVSMTDKARIGLEVLRQNGPAWTAALGVYLASSRLADLAFRSMDTMRRRRALPGLNSVTLNRSLWNSWDWSAAGEEWTISEEWKAALVRRTIDRWLPHGGHLLEIGPGAGRWTSTLLERCDTLTGVDLSGRCVEVCRERFGDSGKAAFFVGSGRDLDAVATSTVDGVWSFDVFVHINEMDVSRYVQEIFRVMKPGAVAVIHHGTVAGRAGGWRSDLTHEAMLGMLGRTGFDLCETFREWSEEGRVYEAGLYEDAITVFRKPAAAS